MRSATAPSRSSRAVHSTTALAWRVIRDGDRRGSENMARDHALALCVRPGEAVLRLYGWTTPTVSFGRNEPARGLYSGRAALERGVGFVRRPTGGRAVLHASELTYAVVVPGAALGGARETYRRINEALAAALGSLGASVSVSDRGVALRLDAGPCFRAPVAGEVVAGGRKLVGSAQARVDGAILQHGSIILSGDPSVLADLRKGAGEGPDPHPGSARLCDLVPGVSREGVEVAVQEALPRMLGGGGSREDLLPRERAEATRLEADRYGRDTWTWRR